MVRAMDILDTVSLTEKKLALEKELSGLQRKSRVQRNRKTYYQREKEKRLSVEMRSLEWLHEYYSCRPKNSSIKDEANSVVTEETTDISDAGIDSEPELHKKPAAQSNSRVQRKSKSHEQKTICSVTNEKEFGNRKEFSEIILELGQSVHNPKQAHTDMSRKKFLKIEKYVINAAYPVLPVQNMGNSGNNPGKNSQENKRKLSSNRTPSNEEKNPRATSIKKLENPPSMKNSKKLEPKVINNSKKPSNIKAQKKIDDKPEIKTSCKKVKGSEVSVTTNTKDDVKPKTQTPALKKPPIGLQNKNEPKVKRKSLNTQNSSSATKSDVGKTTRKFASSAGNSKSSLENKAQMEPAKRDKSMHRAPAKLPETTDVSMKRLLQKQFESKLKAALPSRPPKIENKSEQENVLAKKTSTKKSVEVKSEEKPLKKSNAKSMQVKAKVNSWNKEYVQYVQLKAASLTENKLKVASTCQSVDKKRSLEEEPKSKSVSKVSNKAKLTTWARINDAKKLTEADKAKVEILLKNTNLEVKENGNKQKEEIKVEEKRTDNDEEDYKTLVLDEIKDSEIILKKIPSINEESSDTTLKAEVESESNLRNEDLQETQEISKLESNATSSKMETIKSDKLYEEDSEKFPPYFSIELSPIVSEDSMPGVPNVQALIKAQSNSEILKVILGKDEKPGPSGLSKPVQKNTSEIVLEKKAEVILKKQKESNDIVVKPLEQKKSNKGSIEYRPQARGSKILHGSANVGPSVEVIFAQKMDTKYNPLVEKLLEYRIDLIDQSLGNSKQRDEFSKPSITYI